MSNISHLDFMDTCDGDGNMLIHHLNGSDFKVVNQVSYRHGKAITLSDMSRYTGLSEARVLVSVERLIQSGLIKLSCHIDDFIAMNKQGKSPILTLHLENVQSAIKYLKTKR